MSTFYKMSPAAADGYTIYPDTVAVEPSVSTPAQRPRTIRKHKGPEFYKPFHYILLVYLFFYCSRIPELVPFLHIGMLLQPILLIGMFMTGSTKFIFQSKIGKLMTAFVIWVAICVPFSTWRGGSFAILMLTAQALLLLFFMAAFIRTIDDCFRVMYTFALAMAAIGVMSLLIGGGKIHDQTRLGLGGGNDTLADANFLALYLVVGLPFLWFAASLKSGFMKVCLYLMMIPILAGFARTGSRMGLLALAAGLLLFFIYATAMERASIILGGVLFLACATFMLPQRIIERFTTYFEANTTAGVEAAASAQSRKQLFIRSLQLTAQHPFLGVGPGEFMDAEAIDAAQANHRGMWHYTHNSYTELSSETGLIGMGLFLAAFYKGYRGMTPIRKGYPRALVRRAALFLQIAILMSVIGAFFLSIAYNGILYPMLGISAAFQVAVAKELRLKKMQAREALP